MGRHLLRDHLQRFAFDHIGDGSPFAQGSIAPVACDRIGDGSPFAQEPPALVALGWGQSLFLAPVGRKWSERFSRKQVLGYVAK